MSVKETRKKQAEVLKKILEKQKKNGEIDLWDNYCQFEKIYDLELSLLKSKYNGQRIMYPNSSCFRRF